MSSIDSSSDLLNFTEALLTNRAANLNSTAAHTMPTHPLAAHFDYPSSSESDSSPATSPTRAPSTAAGSTPSTTSFTPSATPDDFVPPTPPVPSLSDYIIPQDLDPVNAENDESLSASVANPPQLTFIRGRKGGQQACYSGYIYSSTLTIVCVPMETVTGNVGTGTTTLHDAL